MAQKLLIDILKSKGDEKFYVKRLLKKDFLLLHSHLPMADKLPDGVIGNTSDSGSEKSRFEPWSGNKNLCLGRGFVVKQGEKFIPVSKAISGSPGRATETST